MKEPRRIAWRERIPKNTPTRFGQDRYGYLLVLLSAVLATAALTATVGGRRLGRFDPAGLRDL